MSNYNDEFQGGWNEEEGVYYAKGSYDNEVEYYNEIICYTNFLNGYLPAIIQSPSQAEKMALIDEVKAMIAENKEHITNLGDYEGDDNLMNKAQEYLNTTQERIGEWKQLFEDLKSNKLDENSVTPVFEDLRQRTENDLMPLQEALNEFENSYFDNDDDDEDFDFESYGEVDFSNPTMEHIDFDENNPLLQPIHGIRLEDYAAAASRLANGMTEEQVAKALGVERPQWDEANQLWIKRMQQDTDFVVTGLYGQYFATADSHPKFQDLEEDSSMPTNQENLQKINSDPYFYYELAGAIQAAYEYGMDGAQWLRDNYGLSIGEFQGVAMKWMTTTDMSKMLGYQEQKAKEYGEKFAKEQGGNIADDVEF
ncbi:hypothetical protein KRX57_04120 [Weeksellaceae bacterium TAE3-ERU29]|nr:hypothetical protein [Weeksellaceae bacterium TAE3-ERU29]